jgi:hyperosmotically inducible protein
LKEETPMRNQWKSILIALALVPVWTGTPLFAGLKAETPKVLMNLDEEVRHRLIMLPYYGAFDWLEWEIQVDHSVVLRGQVRNSQLKADAEAAMRKIEGISGIQNQVEVLPISSSDDQLRVAIYRALFRYDGTMFRYSIQAVPPIHIIVNNGRVVLKGAVANAEDRQITDTVANQTQGVFGVTNELMIEQK